MLDSQDNIKGIF